MKKLLLKIAFRLIGAFFGLAGILSLLLGVQLFRGNAEIEIWRVVLAAVIVVLTLPLALFFMYKASRL